MNNFANNTGLPTSLPTSAPTLTDDAKIESTIFLAVPIFIATLLCFLCIRRRYRSIYMSNQEAVEALQQKSQNGSDGSESNYYLLSAGRKNDKDDIYSLLDIFKTLWGFTTDDIEELAGFDACAFTTVLWNQFMLMLILLPLTFVFLVPVYATAGEVLHGYFITKMTFINVKAGAEAWRLWFTMIIAAVFYTGSTWYLQRKFQELSLRADKYNARNQESKYTALITHLPERYRHESFLRELLSKIFPGEVVNVDMCKDLSELQQLWNTWKGKERRRELCQKQKRKEVGCMCWKRDLEECCLEETEAKDAFFAAKLRDLQNVNVAVAQFRTIKARTIACTSVLIPPKEILGLSMTLTNLDDRPLQIHPVPDVPDEILWMNLGKDIKSHSGKRIGMILYILLIIFFSTIMTTIQGLANLDNMAQIFPPFETVLDWSPSARSFIEGALPALLYSLFFLILPYFIKLLSSLAMPFYRSEEVLLTLQRYSDTLIGTGVLVSVFASGIFSISSFELEQLWEVLGKTVPGQAVFFQTYTIIACFISTGVELAMVLPFFLNLVGLYSPWPFDYAIQYGINILMFTICTTYAVISPLILVWGCFYFFLAYITFTYQLVYVYKRGDETGGLFFPAVYDRLNFGMVIGQVVVIAMLVLKEAYAQAILFLVVPLNTLRTRSHAKRNFGYYYRSTSLKTANEAGLSNAPTQRRNNFVAPAIQALIQAESEDGDEEILIDPLTRNTLL